MHIARELLKYQKDELFEAVRDAGLKPSDFEWRHFVSMMGDVHVAQGLAYRGSEYSFVFDRSWEGGAFPWLEDVVVMSLGEGCLTTELRCASWDDQVRLFAGWLARLVREVNAPDYWSQLAEQAVSASPALAEPAAQGPFDDDERARLRAALSRIERRLTEGFDAGEDRVKFATREVTYLTESAGRLNRRDWTLAAVGVVTTMAARLRLDAPVVAELFAYLREGLGVAASSPPG